MTTFIYVIFITSNNMVSKTKSSQNSNGLKTISFRGDKNKWIDLQYTIKKNGHRNVWEVLEPIIDDYLKKHSNGVIQK